MAKISDIKDILKEEFENKKAFDAKWEAECNLGGEDIMEGDTFYFMGDKKKVCQNCFEEIQETIEAL